MVMFIADLLQWWYGDGWARQVLYAKGRILGIYDYFSIDLLLKTWFSPFRQISAQKITGPLEVRWQAFVDRLISRFIGAFMRTILILTGIVSLVAFTVASAVALVLWALVPLFPFLGAVLAMIGWMPW